MLGKILKIRQPLTVVVLAWTVVVLVGSLVRFGFDVAAIPVSMALRTLALSSFNLGAVVIVLGLLGLCLFVAPPVKGALRLARISAVVFSVGTVVSAAVLVAGVLAPVNTFAVVVELVGGIVDLTCKVAATVTLWVIVKRVNHGTLVLGQHHVTPVPPPVMSDRPSWQPVAGAQSAWTTTGGDHQEQEESASRTQHAGIAS